jgi:hypothetical protein
MRTNNWHRASCSSPWKRNINKNSALLAPVFYLRIPTQVSPVNTEQVTSHGPRNQWRKRLGMCWRKQSYPGNRPWRLHHFAGINCLHLQGMYQTVRCHTPEDSHLLILLHSHPPALQIRTLLSIQFLRLLFLPLSQIEMWSQHQNLKQSVVLCLHF